MKVRHGHVSNSSTSSFFGIGIGIDIEDVREEFLPTREDDEHDTLLEEDGSIIDSYEFWEWLTYDWGKDSSKAAQILNESNVDYEAPYGENGTVVVSYTKMKLDETKQEFIDRVKIALGKVFNIDESKVGHVDDAWRDG